MRYFVLKTTSTILHITTIRYYYEESGADGANLLLDQIRHPDTPVKEIRLGYCLVERESTRR